MAGEVAQPLKTRLKPRRQKRRRLEGVDLERGERGNEYVKNTLMHTWNSQKVTKYCIFKKEEKYF